MQIAEQKVVTLNYKLKDINDNIIDQVDDGSFVYLHGTKNIIPALENALSGKQPGDAFLISISPEEGYGLRDESKLRPVPRDMFPKDAELKIGMQYHAEGPSGEKLMITIAEISDETVTIDGNLPLAGMQLNFDVTVVDVREATQEELEHSHIHGPGCSH